MRRLSQVRLDRSHCTHIRSPFHQNQIIIQDDGSPPWETIAALLDQPTPSQETKLTAHKRIKETKEALNHATALNDEAIEEFNDLAAWIEANTTE